MHAQTLVRRLCLAGTILLCSGMAAYAQDNSLQTDTLRLTRRQTEEIFLRKNLQLLAKHYEVAADSALIRQARLWDNPVLNTDQNVYSNGGFFRHGTDAAGNGLGQYYIQVEQLIKTAGKRGKEIKMATTNANITQWEFYDLMRNLKYQLRSDFYTVAQLENNARLYNRQMEQLGRLISGMDAQFKAGNVAKKDVLRVQALRMSTEMEQAENARKLSDVQAELRTLLQLTDTTYIAPVVDDASLASLPEGNVDQLVNEARKSNSAYQLQSMQVAMSRLNLAYQKSLAVPDVTLGPNFDRNSNYTPNYWGLGISLPLPLFNRNQGNIKSARFQMQQQETGLSAADLELTNKVQNAYRKLLITQKLNNDNQKDFYSDYTKLYNNVVESYNNRQINLLEFIDYFNDYEDVREKQLQQELNIRLAKEELNYQVGADVVQ